nr:hypothetical protein [uncultured Ruminococcus sp.]
MRIFDNGIYRDMTAEEIKIFEQEKGKYPPVNIAEEQIEKISEVFADE